MIASMIMYREEDRISFDNLIKHPAIKVMRSRFFGNGQKIKRKIDR
jgi:hypothetical protein